MTTETMTLAAYARTHDASRQAASKWQARGYLVMRDGLVDVAASDAAMKMGAQGRYRTKAHGGRRTEGVRGAIDRPALGYVGGRKVEPQPEPVAEPDKPWIGWHRLGNPATFAQGVMEKIDAGAAGDAADLIDFREWEEACTFAGWDQWPETAGPALALALGLKGRDRAVVDALRRLVRERCASLDWDEADLADDRLEPR